MTFHCKLLAGVAGCALLLGTAGAQQTSNPPSSSGQTGQHRATAPGSNQPNANRLMTADSDFVRKAAQGGMAEVELGRLATSKASNEKVKQFGQRMVDDHSKANNELKEVASRKGVTLPTSLDAKDQSTKDKLSKLSGAEFDKAYMEDMVKDHKTDVSEFRKESNSGSDPDVKSFASKTLPTLEEHLKLAEDTLAQVKNEK
jgi:putative membrane protein